MFGNSAEENILD